MLELIKIHFKEYLEREDAKFDFIVYVGDGSNDFCPMLRFSSFIMISNKSLETETYFCFPSIKGQFFKI